LGTGYEDEVEFCFCQGLGVGFSDAGGGACD
jgi:hypothetical protein